MTTDSILNWLPPATAGSTVLFLVAFAIMPLLRRASAAVRHSVWAAAFVGAMFFSAALLLPKWNLPLLAPNVAVEKSQVSAIPTVGARVTPFVPVSQQGEETPVPVSGQTVGLRGTIAIVWVAGVLLGWGQLGRGLWALRKIQRTSAAATSELGIDIACAVRISSRIVVPLTYGFFRPQILLPASYRGWTTEERRLALLHEMAHVRRRDWVIQLVAQVLKPLFWFNPLVWLAARRLTLEQEKAADDLVLAETEGNAYANALVGFARRFANASGVQALPALPILRAGALEARVRSLLDSSVSRRATSRAQLFVTVIVLVAVGIGPVIQLTARETATTARSTEAKRQQELRNLTEMEKRFVGKWLGGGMFHTTFDFREDGTYTMISSVETNVVKGTWRIDYPILTYTAAPEFKAAAKKRRILQVSTDFFQWQFEGEASQNIFGYRRIGNVGLGSITGGILMEGKPKSNIPVLLEQLNPVETERGTEWLTLVAHETTTDEEGRFAFHGLTPGLYKVSRFIRWNAVTDEGTADTGTWTHGQLVRLEKDQTAKVLPTPGRTLTGELAPPQGMTKEQLAYTAGDFRFLTAAIREKNLPGIVYVLDIDRDGKFRVPELPPGEYNLFTTVRAMAGRLDGEDVASVSTNITVPTGTTPFDVGTIQLARVAK